MAEDVIVWKVQSRWIPVSTMTINFGKTVDVDDPIDIQLFEAEQNLGKFSINGDLASIYKTAKEKTHDGPFFGEVTTCLIQDSKNKWWFVWHEREFGPSSRLMIFPTAEVSEKPKLFSASAFGQACENPELAKVLHSLLPKNKEK